MLLLLAIFVLFLISLSIPLFTSISNINIFVTVIRLPIKLIILLSKSGIHYTLNIKTELARFYKKQIVYFIIRFIFNQVKNPLMVIKLCHKLNIITVRNKIYT